MKRKEAIRLMKKAMKYQRKFDRIINNLDMYIQVVDEQRVADPIYAKRAKRAEDYLSHYGAIGGL